MAFFKVDSAVLHQADRSQSIAALRSFANRSGRNWLRPGHPVKDGRLPTRWSVANCISSASIIEGLAASGPNHCIDGWSFAARALSATLAGDAHATRHLAYYTQLRAGLSLLAACGIGVFNKLNFIIDVSGAVRRVDKEANGLASDVGMGTHDAVWELLAAWISSPTAATAFLSLIRVRGVPLSDLIEAIWPSSGSHLAGTLIQAWGVDLKRGRADHTARNQSSYDPQIFTAIAPSVAETLQFTQNFWHLFEPSGAASFDSLDRYLLRNLLQSQSRFFDPKLPYDAGAIGMRYENLPASIRSLASKEFLEGKEEVDNPPLLRWAHKRTSPALPLEMLARAFLLLRLATGFTHTNLVEAGLTTSGELRPWLDELGEARGYWKPGSAVGELSDLWADVELALSDIAVSLSIPPSCVHDWLSVQNRGTLALAEAERAGLWSLGS